MLRFIGTLARILFGLTLASLAAGLLTVLFVDIDILSNPHGHWPKALGETIDLALLAATHIGIFSAIFVAIPAAIGEWLSIRSLTFYLLVGGTIAILGFTAQYASEVAGQPTILNNYAIKAFLTVGFFGGFVYWLAAGQFAGRGPEVQPALGDEPATETTRSPRLLENGDNTSVVITHPPAAGESFESRQRWRIPTLERLKFSRRETEARPDIETSATLDDETSPSRRT